MEVGSPTGPTLPARLVHHMCRERCPYGKGNNPPCLTPHPAPHHTLCNIAVARRGWIGRTLTPHVQQTSRVIDTRHNMIPNIHLHSCVNFTRRCGSAHAVAADEPGSINVHAAVHVLTCTKHWTLECLRRLPTIMAHLLMTIVVYVLSYLSHFCECTSVARRTAAPACVACPYTPAADGRCTHIGVCEKQLHAGSQ
jgi:hypothetical protein